MKKVSFQCKMDETLRDAFLYACRLEDKNGSQVLRSLMRSHVGEIYNKWEIEDEETQIVIEEEPPKLYQGGRSASEEPSKNNERRVPNISSDLSKRDRILAVELLKRGRELV